MMPPPRRGCEDSENLFCLRLQKKAENSWNWISETPITRSQAFRTTSLYGDPKEYKLAVNLIIPWCNEWTMHQEGRGMISWNQRVYSNNPLSTSVKKLPIAVMSYVARLFVNTKISSLSGVSRSCKLKEELLITTPELSCTPSGLKVTLGGCSFFLWLKHKILGLTQILV